MSTVKKRKWSTIRRDTIIWVMGVGLTLNELLVEPEIRSQALVFCGLLLGLPGILAANEFAKKVLSAVENASVKEE